MPKESGDIMIRIVLLGITTIFTALLFRGGKSEYSVLIGFVGCLLIFSAGIGKLENIFDAMNRFQKIMGQGSQYYRLLIRMLGITYLAESASALCKDAGCNAVGAQIEMVGKLTILAMSTPILMALLEYIEEFWG